MVGIYFTLTGVTMAQNKTPDPYPYESLLTGGTKHLDALLGIDKEPTLTSKIDGEQDDDSTEYPKYFTGVYLGWYSLTGDLGDNYDFGEGPIFETQFQMQFNQTFAPFISIGYAYSEEFGFDPFTFISYELGFTQYTLDIGTKVYPLGDQKFRPYLEGRFGIYHLEIELTIGTLRDSDTDFGFGFSIGGGVEYVFEGEQYVLQLGTIYRLLSDTELEDSGATFGEDRLDIILGVNIRT